LLKRKIDSTPSKHQIITLDDLNSRVGNDVIPGIKQRFDKNEYNSNGELLVECCTNINLRINNTFSDHKSGYICL
jgi:hypothetical protein